MSRVAVRLDRSVDGLADLIDVRVDGDARLVIAARANGAVQAAELANAVALEIVSDPALLGAPADTYGFVQSEMEATIGRIADVGLEVDRVEAQIDDLGSDALLASLIALEAEQRALRDELAGLFDRHRDFRATLARDTADIPGIVQSARPPESPVLPRPALNALLAGILGAVLVLPLAASTMLASTVRSASDVRDLTGLEVLGTIVRPTISQARHGDHRLARLIARDDPVSEGYRSLRWGLGTVMSGLGIRDLLVVGADRVEGANVVAVNLAILAAQSGRRVLVVDADIRDPMLHQVLETVGEPGLVDVLAHAGPHPGFAIQATAIPGLDLLPAGHTSSSPMAILEPERLRNSLDEFASHYDQVIIVGPSLRDAADAGVVGSAVGSSLIVFDVGITTQQSAGHVLHFLGYPGVYVPGSVLVRLPRGVYLPLRDPARGQRRHTGRMSLATNDQGR